MSQRIAGSLTKRTDKIRLPAPFFSQCMPRKCKRCHDIAVASASKTELGTILRYNNCSDGCAAQRGHRGQRWKVTANDALLRHNPLNARSRLAISSGNYTYDRKWQLWNARANRFVDERWQALLRRIELADNFFLPLEWYPVAIWSRVLWSKVIGACIVLYNVRASPRDFYTIRFIPFSSSCLFMFLALYVFVSSVIFISVVAGQAWWLPFNTEVHPQNCIFSRATCMCTYSNDPT